MESNKRGRDETALTVVDNAQQPKKQKTSTDLVLAGNNKNQLIPQAPKRTSKLESPIMKLTGHKGEVYSAKFSPSGNLLASASFDKTIFLWNVYEECVNFCVFKGHTNAVLEVQWSPDEEQVYSASADKSLCVWSVQNGQRLRRLKGHKGIVNSVAVARRGLPALFSASDDATVKHWDMRTKSCVNTFACESPVLAVEIADSNEQVFTAGVDNSIKVWDVRKNSVLYTLDDHTDSITGLRLSPDGTHLLSNSMDNSLRIWDVRPFVQQQRCVRYITGTGVQHGVEKNLLRSSWSRDGAMFSCGSADSPTHVYIFAFDQTIPSMIANMPSCRMLYKLPGHHGSVNETDFSPSDNIVVSASSDKSLFLGEYEPSTLSQTLSTLL